MGILQNLHTHSTYCDGKHTLEEMIGFAIEKGFSSLGFSGHSYIDEENTYCMTYENTQKYKDEVNFLKNKYKDKIEIFLGLEFDKISKDDKISYDYIIGTSHYLTYNNKIIDFDRSYPYVEKLINEEFNGDGMKFAKRYFEELSTLPNYGKFDILGHFDIIAKNNRNYCFFNEESKEYLSSAYECMKILKDYIPVFEVNTGCISRGYRQKPYPNITLLKEFKNLGYEVVITSDCHDGNYLDCYFDKADKLLLECGFKYKQILTKDGFKGVMI